jgi:hypothetical protein
VRLFRFTMRPAEDDSAFASGSFVLPFDDRAGADTFAAGLLCAFVQSGRPDVAIAIGVAPVTYRGARPPTRPRPRSLWALRAV